MENLIQMRSRTDLSTSVGVRPVHKLAKYARESSNKMHKLETYNEAIDNLIYENGWRKAIQKEL